MRIETNEKLVKRNTRLATYLFFFTFAVLIAGFFVTNSLFIDESASVLVLLIPPGLLIVGLISTVTSVRMTNLWARQPRPENALEEGLKGLSKQSVLYNYHHFPTRHALICPQGVFAIVTPWQAGRHTASGDTWKTHRGFFGWIMSTLRFDNLGNPMEKASQAADHLQALLADIAPDVTVQPLVVFIDSNAQLDLDDPAVPVVYADAKKEPNLTDYMRQLLRESKEKEKGRSNLPLTQEQIDAFEAATLRNQ